LYGRFPKEKGGENAGGYGRNSGARRQSKVVQEHDSLLVLALLAFAVGGTSDLVGAVFRLVLERSDRFRGAVIDWAHDKGSSSIFVSV
jgi:hypothetical protein